VCDFILNVSYPGQLALTMSTFVCKLVVKKAIFGKSHQHMTRRPTRLRPHSSSLAVLKL